MPQTPPTKTDQAYSKHIMFALGALVMAILVAVLVRHYQNKSAPAVATPDVTPPIAIVQVTNKGFVPSTINVKSGTVVEWVGKDPTTSHIVAANPYPSHIDLPGLVSTQLGNGAKYRFKFTKIGTYNYHDDLNPTINGSVNVTN